MKRLIAIALLIFALALTGCSKDTAETESEVTIIRGTEIVFPVE